MKCCSAYFVQTCNYIKYKYSVPCDAEMSITAAKVSRQIQRLAEKLVHIFKRCSAPKPTLDLSSVTQLLTLQLLGV